jgi:hypothetical protein
MALRKRFSSSAITACLSGGWRKVGVLARRILVVSSASWWLFVFYTGDV